MCPAVYSRPLYLLPFLSGTFLRPAYLPALVLIGWVMLPSQVSAWPSLPLGFVCAPATQSPLYICQVANCILYC